MFLILILYIIYLIWKLRCCVKKRFLAAIIYYDFINLEMRF